jgi:hypothetical protein
VAPVTVRGRDLRALAAIVSEDRTDLPDGEGLPPSLLADLMGQIRCDQAVFLGFDIDRQGLLVPAGKPAHRPRRGPANGDRPRVLEALRESRFCSYPGHTGDLRSITKVTDFYSARQWHSTGMYTDCSRLEGIEHTLMLCLPEAPGRTAGPERHVRLYLDRGGPGRTSPSGTGRCSRCRARTCTRPTWMPSAAVNRFPAHPPAGRAATAAGRGAHQHPDRPPSGRPA